MKKDELKKKLFDKIAYKNYSLCTAKAYWVGNLKLVRNV